MGKDAKYLIRLDGEERQQLQALIRKGGRAAAVLKRARVLLQADQSEDGPAWPDEQIAPFAQVGLSTVHRVRQRFVEEGLEAAVFRKPASNRLYRKFGSSEAAKFVIDQRQKLLRSVRFPLLDGGQGAGDFAHGV